MIPDPFERSPTKAGGLTATSNCVFFSLIIEMQVIHNLSLDILFMCE